jgi:A/G-specific adenine glycosylase
MEEQQEFTKQLLNWHKRHNTRQMPWKGEKDPYRIWLSEIILQQTRVEQGLAYYERFIAAFPTISALARADDTIVFKLWEGLGYYSRCKNLIQTARLIANDLQGIFPDTYEGLLALKGVGPYTAAAIASFAYNLPYAVLDGNVFRILARYFGKETPIDSTIGKQEFGHLAQLLLPTGQAASYNQAIMDFGATVCKPKAPGCTNCPLRKHCKALLTERISRLPVKEKKITRSIRWFDYLVIDYKNKTWVRKRPVGDIWENLYEFVLVEHQIPPGAVPDVATTINQVLGNKTFELEQQSTVYRQQLTHQTIVGRFFRVKVKEKLIFKGYEAVEAEKLEKLAFPKFITQYLKDKKLTLNLL